MTMGKQSEKFLRSFDRKAMWKIFGSVLEQGRWEEAKQS